MNSTIKALKKVQKAKILAKLIAKSRQPKTRTLAKLITTIASKNTTEILARRLASHKIPFKLTGNQVEVCLASDLDPAGKKLLQDFYGFKPEDLSSRPALVKDVFKTNIIKTKDEGVDKKDVFKDQHGKKVIDEKPSKTGFMSGIKG